MPSVQDHLKRTHFRLTLAEVNDWPSDVATHTLLFEQQSDHYTILVKVGADFECASRPPALRDLLFEVDFNKLVSDYVNAFHPTQYVIGIFTSDCLSQDDDEVLAVIITADIGGGFPANYTATRELLYKFGVKALSEFASDNCINVSVASVPEYPADEFDGCTVLLTGIIDALESAGINFQI
jgi:hypothetical protein